MLSFMRDVTHILTQIESGNSLSAEQSLPQVYDELRKLATSHRLANMNFQGSVGRNICNCVGHSGLRESMLTSPGSHGPGNRCIGPPGPESLWKVPEP